MLLNLLTMDDKYKFHNLIAEFNLQMQQNSD